MGCSNERNAKQRQVYIITLQGYIIFTGADRLLAYLCAGPTGQDPVYAAQLEKETGKTCCKIPYKGINMPQAAHKRCVELGMMSQTIMHSSAVIKGTDAPLQRHSIPHPEPWNSVQATQKINSRSFQYYRLSEPTSWPVEITALCEISNS